MHNALVSLVLLSLAGSFASCASAGPYPQVGAPGGGVTGATLKHPAVQNPDTLDFGGDVQTVENYDLDASAAGMSNAISGSDAARDQEIDALVNKIIEKKRPSAPPVSPAMAPAPSGRRPAVPPLPNAGGSVSGSGVSAAIPNVKTQPGPPPLPVQAASAPTPEQREVAARQEALFPKPLWRRLREQQISGNPPRDPLPRGF